jgi:hypothetical protein
MYLIATRTFLTSFCRDLCDLFSAVSLTGLFVKVHVLQHTYLQMQRTNVQQLGPVLLIY